jgi:hypothetical protein
MKIVYQALLLLLLSLTSNSSGASCDLCGVGQEFDAFKSINETTLCSVFGLAALGDEGQGVDDDACTSLNVDATASGCCSDLAPTASPYTDSVSSCSICGADGTLANPSFAFSYDDPDSTEIETITCAQYEESLLIVINFGLDLSQGAPESVEIAALCKLTFDVATEQGCQCEGSPAAHANVKIASLVVVGVTFMASFFF